MSAYRDAVAVWMRGFRLPPSAPQWQALRSAMAASAGDDAALAAAVEQVRAALSVAAKGRAEGARDDIGDILTHLPAQWSERIPAAPSRQRIDVRASLSAAAATIPVRPPDGGEWVQSVSRARGMLGPVLAMLSDLGEADLASRVTQVDGTLALAATMGDGAVTAPRPPDVASAPPPAPKRADDKRPAPRPGDRRLPDNGPIRPGGGSWLDLLGGPGWLPVIVGAGIALATDSPAVGIAAGAGVWYWQEK